MQATAFRESTKPLLRSDQVEEMRGERASGGRAHEKRNR